MTADDGGHLRMWGLLGLFGYAAKVNRYLPLFIRRRSAARVRRQGCDGFRRAGQVAKDGKSL